MIKPVWYENLLKDIELNKFNIETFEKYENDFFYFANIHQFNKKFGGPYISLMIDGKNPQKLLVRLGFDDEIMFFVSPDIKSIECLYNSYLFPTEKLDINQSNDVLLAQSILAREKYEVLELENSKKLLFFIGNGDWDSGMINLENDLFMNQYIATYSGLCQATTEGIDGNYTQMYTQYSKSLITLIRSENFGTTVFFYQIEYFPIKNDYELFFNSSNYENLSKDAPLDILGFLNNSHQTYTIDKIFEEADAGLYNSALILSLMIDLMYKDIQQNKQKFEEYFLQLLKNKNANIRKFVKDEAFNRGNEKICSLILENNTDYE